MRVEDFESTYELQSLSKREKDKLLSRLYWDRNVELSKLYHLLYGETDECEYLDKTNLFCRLLSTYDWYTLLKLIPLSKSNDILSEQVLNRLYPKELKKKFLYARKILSK